MRSELIRQLCNAAAVLNSYGAMPATDGNFSARLTDSAVLLTRAGIPKRSLTEADFVEAPLNEVRPNGGSSEWLMHRAIYLTRPNIRCVLHAHAPALCAFAAVHRAPNANLFAESALLVGEIALVPFAEPGTSQLGESLISASGNSSVYLLANHGAVSVGTSVAEALFRLERAEFLALAEIRASGIGTPVPLHDEVVSRMRLRMDSAAAGTTKSESC